MGLQHGCRGDTVQRRPIGEARYELLGFAPDAAEKTGQSKRTVNQAVARGEKIVPSVLYAITHGSHLVR